MAQWAATYGSVAGANLELAARVTSESIDHSGTAAPYDGLGCADCACYAREKPAGSVDS